MGIKGRSDRSRVALVRTADRAEGVRRAIEILGINPVASRHVLLKPNFNTADPFPASTHNGTLRALVSELRRMGARGITVGERSGPVDTDSVLRDKGIPEIAAEMGFDVINFERLPASDWVSVQPPGSHWRKGFMAARPVVESECVVCTCCLKTHAYGGVFTGALKLSIGTVSKKNMTELHSSLMSMRKMIAEVNVAYTPALVVMDAIEVFTSRGPMSGPKARPDLILASADRVAIDAVGVSILKSIGSTREIMDTPVFSHEQIARAVELGLGASGPEEIEIASDDQEGEEVARRLRGVLSGTGR